MTLVITQERVHVGVTRRHLELLQTHNKPMPFVPSQCLKY